MVPVSTQVSVEVGVSREWFFYWFTSVDLPKVMQKYGPIPGVAGIEEQTGPMHVPGSSRVLLLSDGTTAIEQVTSVEPPREVKYLLHELTGFFRHFVVEAQGELWFSEVGTRSTRVEWRYSFIGRNPAATLVLKLLIPLFWKGYMRSALTRSRRLAETQAPEPPPDGHGTGVVQSL